MFYSVASLLLIGDLWRCESWQWYHCVVVPSLFLRPARSPIEVVVIFILLVSFSMVFLTKPYLMLLAGFFIGIVFQDLRRDFSVIYNDEKIHRRQIDFYARPLAELLGVDRYFSHATTGIYVLMLLLAVFRFYQKLSRLSFVTLACVIGIGAVYLLQIDPAIDVLRQTTASFAEKIDNGATIMASHIVLAGFCLIIFLSLVASSQRKATYLNRDKRD